MGLANPIIETNWFEAIQPAYTDGKPNFLDENGDLVPGIYSGLENDVYHGLPAYSSSLIKLLAKKTPAHALREYFSDKERKRTLTQVRTLDTGTLGHELILEPEGFNSRYFRLPLHTDFSDMLFTADEMKAKCKELKLKVSGTKSELTERLLAHDPSIRIFDVIMLNHLQQGAGEAAVAEAKAAVERKQCSSVVRAFEIDDVKRLAKKQPVDGLVWDDAQSIFESFSKHPRARKLISNGWAELAVIVKCPVTGLWLKCKFDYINKLAIASDVKTTRTCDPVKFVFQCKDLRYDVQESYYKYVGNLAGIPVNSFAFIGIEYAEADICEVFETSKRRQSIANADMHSALEVLKTCLETDDWHGYSRFGEIIVLDW